MHPFLGINSLSGTALQQMFLLCTQYHEVTQF